MKQILVELQDFMGGDRAVADAAWTSSTDYQKKNARTEADVERVVTMLADLKHSVPFESVVLRWWIKMPIAIDRQFMTHRIASHSGMSGRYRTMPAEFLELPDDVRVILKKMPQGVYWERDYEALCAGANDFYQHVSKEAKEHQKAGKITNAEYKRFREFFRGTLPQHNMTERVSIMNLRSWANFYKLRSKPDAQPEIQQIANLMLEELKKKNVAPIALKALEKNNWGI